MRSITPHADTADASDPEVALSRCEAWAHAPREERACAIERLRICRQIFAAGKQHYQPAILHLVDPARGLYEGTLRKNFYDWVREGNNSLIKDIYRRKLERLNTHGIKPDKAAAYFARWSVDQEHWARAHGMRGAEVSAALHGKRVTPESQQILDRLHREMAAEPSHLAADEERRRALWHAWVRGLH